MSVAGLAVAGSAGAQTATPQGSCPGVSASVHVSPNGSDSGPGTAAQPFRTIQHAVDVTGAGAKIIVHEGDYLESVVIRGSSRRLYAAPGETVWITGSDKVSSWSDMGDGTWRSTDQVAADLDQRATFDAAGMLDQRPIAGHLAMVFVDGQQLEQVESVADVDAGSFLVEDGRVRIGRNPAGSYVDVGRRSVGLLLDDASGSIISGIGFRRHPTSYAEKGAVRVDEGTHNVLIEQSVFRDNGNIGLQVLGDNASVVHNRFSGNGRMGMNAHQADGLFVGHNRFDGNNRERFDTAAAAGGLKVTASRNLRIEGNRADGNHASAYWVDVSSLGITIAGNRSENNERFGYHVEVSAQAKVVSNYSTGDERSIQIAESNDVRVYNNLLVDPDEHAIAVLDGARDSATASGNEFGLPHDNRYSFPIPEISWNIHDVDVRNNVLVRGSTDSPMLFVQHTTDPQPALALGVYVDHNLYHRASSSSPRWVVAWGNSSGSTDNYETVWGFRSAMGAAGSGNGTGSIGRTGATVTAVANLSAGNLDVRSGGPGDGAGAPIPADIAAAVGSSASDIGLLVDPGAAAGPTCTAVGQTQPPPIDTDDPIPAHPFSDVPGGTWYTEPIAWLYATGATTGTTPSTFSPHRTVTRAELATFIWRLAGEPDAADHPFRDVASGTYYDDAVSWLYATGATTGTTPTTFSPTKTATRAELATLIWRLAGRPYGGGHPFVDVASGTYYFQAVGWLAAVGGTTGTSPTTFSPHRTATRAEVAAIIWRLVDADAWID